MPTFKSLIFLNAYEDSTPSNQSSKQNFRWTREINNASISNALSETFQLAPGASQSLFNGIVSLTQDNTTEYSLALVPLNTSVYQLSYASGTVPGFRTLRSIGLDTTSQVTTSINGTVLTYTFSGGTLPNLSSIVAGDQVLIGDEFNLNNQGIWTIISSTSDSISIVNANGYIEGPITLGSDFAMQLRIFSGSGVQIGDILQITNGFSPVSRNSYSITQVTDIYIRFSYTGSLPTENDILTEVSVYYMAKSFIYLEADQNVTILLNESETGPQITPLISNGIIYPGMFLLNSTIYSLSVINDSINQANITLLSVE